MTRVLSCIPRAGAEVGWLVGDDVQLLVVSVLGDLFLRNAEGQILWLDTGAARLSRVAESADEFKRASKALRLRLGTRNPKTERGSVRRSALAAKDARELKKDSAASEAAAGHRPALHDAPVHGEPRRFSSSLLPLLLACTAWESARGLAQSKT